MTAIVEEEGSCGKQGQKEAKEAEGERRNRGGRRQDRRGDQDCDWQRRKEEGSGSHRRLATTAGCGKERKKGRWWRRLAYGCTKEEHRVMAASVVVGYSLQSRGGEEEGGSGVCQGLL
ncbi:hypothetical protein BHE74_00021096 [Ensete ventricosum]|nr:hypothetical protein BHE74_00021096 [Ensete ventricosum]RZR91025.1 hypothetical protein BHM03_00019063 [Ensete ventricosum]